MAKHDSKVGDLFRASWGYDQTNVDFYQVVRVTPASVEVREIESEIVEGAGSPSVRVRAVKDAFKEGRPPKVKRVKNGSIKVYSFARAYPAEWDKTYHETGWGFGH